MKKRKNLINYFVTFTLLSLSLISCEFTKDRPILKLPDGNKDRMDKNIFTGTLENPKYWIYKVTVVDTTFDGDSVLFEGIQSKTKAGYFEFTRDKLKFNNIVNRQSLEKPEVASKGLPELINSWDINHFQARLAEIDGYTTNTEEENKYIRWDQKDQFTINWSTANISEVNTFPYLSIYQTFKCWTKKSSHVIDSSRTHTNDYISFVISVEYEQNPLCTNNLKRHVQGNYVNTIHYKYSFKTIPDPRLANNSYTPYVYSGEQDPLLKKYGYFKTIRPGIATDNRGKNIFYMNRWNPNKKHTFYFSKDYPDKYKHIAHGLICHTNKLFAKHKLNNYPLNGKCTDDGSVLPTRAETCSEGICFELKENSGQQLGDIRYSFFHMIDIEVPVLGYGPSDAHPATGEIISGNVITTTYYLDYYLKYLLQDSYKRDLEKYYGEDGDLITNTKNKYDKSSLFVKMKRTLQEEDHLLWTETSKALDKDADIRPEFEYLISKLTFGYPAWSSFTNRNNQSHSASNSIDFNTQTRSTSILEQHNFLNFNNPSSVVSNGFNINNGFNMNNISTPFLSFEEDAHLQKIMPETLIEETKKAIEDSQKLLEAQNLEHNTTIYPMEPVLAQIPSMLANGMKPEEVKKRILFNLMSHEFGHVLNLRHNFYGSVDVKHWHAKENLNTSSVMDYMRLKEEAKGPLKALFGHYDEAALVYAYSGGKKDLSIEKNTQYLFCTDHHVPLNALCNRWDTGNTPSQVVKSLIENYEERYFIRNLRTNRDYWNTQHYPSIIFFDLWHMKKFLMMWRTAFRDNYISKALNESTKSYTQDRINFITHYIQKDIKQAIKLSLAFYNSILQMPRSDRDWQTIYDEESGSIERLGIFWDKLFAMFFLMGNNGFLYNPNHYLGRSSYLTYIDKLNFRQMIEEIMENTLTKRVDMEPWFISYGRYLYAKNTADYYNLLFTHTTPLLEKIGVRCYTPKGLKDNFGIDPYAYKANADSPPDFLDTAIIPMENHLTTITDNYYSGTNENLGITFFDGNYYVASSNLNKYSFTIIDSMKRSTHGWGEKSLRLDKQDVYDMFYLYYLFKKGEVPQSCDNGY